MLHEILFALLGHTGSIFIEEVKPVGIANIDELADEEDIDQSSESEFGIPKPS